MIRLSYILKTKKVISPYKKLVYLISRFYVAAFFLVLLIISTTECSDEKDESFTLAEYRKMGVPDPGIKWSKHEYGQALSVLRSQKLYGSMSLPRKFSRKSGTIFKRLVSIDNISFVNDTNIPLMDKAYLIQHFGSFQEGMIGLYTYQVKDPRYYNHELIDIFIFGLAINNDMLYLAEKLRMSENMDEKLMSANSDVVHKNYTKLIYKILIELKKSDIYKNRELKRLSNSVSESLSKNWKKIDSDERVKISFEVRQILKSPVSKTIKKNIEPILRLSADN